MALMDDSATQIKICTCAAQDSGKIVNGNYGGS
jgi:hypothetical protein